MAASDYDWEAKWQNLIDRGVVQSDKAWERDRKAVVADMRQSALKNARETFDSGSNRQSMSRGPSSGRMR